MNFLFIQDSSASLRDFVKWPQEDLAENPSIGNSWTSLDQVLKMPFREFPTDFWGLISKAMLTAPRASQP